jgi:alpha-glucuronidase
LFAQQEFLADSLATIDSVKWRPATALLGTLLFLGFSAGFLQAETGEDAWLRYAPLAPRMARQYESLPASSVVLGNSPALNSSQAELIRGVRGMLGRTLRAEWFLPTERSFILGTMTELHALAPALQPPAGLSDNGFWITTARVRGYSCLIVTSPTGQGVLYGVFTLLRKLALGEEVAKLDEIRNPSAPLRWVDEWDNLDGTIERGYAGPSIFFVNGRVRTDLRRVRDYGRLLASLGINGCVVNNVNADPKTLEDNFLPQLARIADTLRPWGVRVGLSANFASPKQIGGLNTFDPLDPAVAAWWQHKIDQIYQKIPDFGGFVMKADSEGQLGPSTYGRSPADAANMIARALKPHGGFLFYRAFVYNHHLDWRDPKNDRARAAYEIFHPLDGQFDDNVILQIKYGPIDFQVREPVSPLFGGLEKTNAAIELQITQEYTGQQRHLCFLVPMWKEVLDFDLHAKGSGTPVKEIVEGKTFRRPAGGFVGVANAGSDATWLGNPLAMANLYGFGRLAWNPNLSAKTIVDEWTRLTFGNDPLVVQTISAMQLASWHVYESYTGPLGLQTLTNILGSHYGPGVESSEQNGWGQWHRADHEGVGMDRTVATGTGFAGQYPPAVARLYESLNTTPDDLLLFFHHVPYTYVLRSGKTVIQEIYDLHYEGAEHAREFVAQWEGLRGRVDEERYAGILARLQYQAGHAIVWRDAVSNWFHRESGIPDAKGRVGHHPDRTEAETMQLRGYTPMEVTPWENASGGKGVECAAPAANCTAEFRFDRPAGWYEIDVQYFDQNNGESRFRVLVNHQTVDEWVADDHLPSKEPGGDTSTRRWIPGIALRPGDEIVVDGVPQGEERAPFDYIAIHPWRRSNRPANGR